jgi:predicted dehydrogenase
MAEPLALELDQFVSCIRTGAAPRADGQSGLRCVRVLAAAQASLERDGAPVQVG